MKTNTRKGVYKTESSLGTVEYSPKQTFTMSPDKSNFNFEEYKACKVQEILKANPVKFVSTLDHLTVISNDKVTWNVDAINLLNLDALMMACNVISNTK